MIRPIRVLWNEVIGFVFLVLAFLAAPSAYRHVRDFNGDGESVFKLLMTGLFILVMAYFGISSFVRARKISRS
ncbi:MAG: hypothetical protein HYZ57_12085 [Acidobacteria bacterium]|nr:hypothetical protein [Acidobacteriota bacterium]MBI3280569.1 hypothetical protein [Acidobacteriota bacterium]